MDEVQRQYKQKLTSILQMNTNPKIKTLMVQNLINTLKECQDINKIYDGPKSRCNYEVLSTSISQCQSISYQTEKDIQELEQKIIKMRMVKFQNNQDIEIYEEENQEMEKIVRAKNQYNDHLKKLIDCKMENIQQSSGQKNERDRDKSILNKSLDTVTNILKITKWWG